MWRQTHRENPCGNGGREIAVMQLQATKHRGGWQTTESQNRAKEDSPCQLHWEQCPADPLTQTSSPTSCETFQSPSVWQFAAEHIYLCFQPGSRPTQPIPRRVVRLPSEKSKSRGSRADLCSRHTRPPQAPTEPTVTAGSAHRQGRTQLLSKGRCMFQSCQCTFQTAK